MTSVRIGSLCSRPSRVSSSCTQSPGAAVDKRTLRHYHRLEDEAADVVELIQTMGQPVFLLGHSYGAHVALLAAALAPRMVQRLILYEPPAAGLLDSHMETLEAHARQPDWATLSYTFFRDVLHVPLEDLDALRDTELWQPILADAPATIWDLRALSQYDFRPEAFRQLITPVMLQIGSESPRHLYATDALAAVLPDCRIDTLDGQAHEAMTTAPEQYISSVVSFLKDTSRKVAAAQ